MKVERLGNIAVSKNINNNPSFKGFYNSKLLKRGLEFAADNGVMFSGATCVLLSSVFRPIAVLLTPKAKKEDKQYTCARSITSGLLGFGVMAAVSVPIVKAVDKIMKNPAKFLKEKTIKNLQGNAKSLGKSGTFSFATQMVKLGSQFLTAEPKAYLSCALVPPLMTFLFNTDPHPNDKPLKKEEKPNGNVIKVGNSTITFKGRIGQAVTNTLSKGIAKFFNWEPLQKFSEKYKDTNLAQHMFSLNDIYLTALFIKYTSKNKDIKEERKKTLNYNAGLVTGLTIPVSYGISRMLDRKTEKFISNLKKANPNDLKMDKYIEGVKIAKPALIMGALYYIVAPVVSTLLADVMARKIDGKK